MMRILFEKVLMAFTFHIWHVVFVLRYCYYFTVNVWKKLCDFQCYTKVNSSTKDKINTDCDTTNGIDWTLGGDFKLE